MLRRPAAAVAALVALIALSAEPAAGPSPAPAPVPPDPPSITLAAELAHAAARWVPPALAAVPAPIPPPPPPPSTTTTTVARPAPAPSSSPSCGGWLDLLAAHWPEHELARACRVMLCESGGDPTIHNPGPSTASGLWQMLDSTWEAWGSGPPPAAAYPAAQQTAAAFALWQASGWSPWVCR